MGGCWGSYSARLIEGKFCWISRHRFFRRLFDTRLSKSRMEHNRIGCYRKGNFVRVQGGRVPGGLSGHHRTTSVRGHPASSGSASARVSRGLNAGIPGCLAMKPINEGSHKRPEAHSISRAQTLQLLDKQETTFCCRETGTQHFVVAVEKRSGVRGRRRWKTKCY